MEGYDCGKRQGQASWTSGGAAGMDSARLRMRFPPEEKPDRATLEGSRIGMGPTCRLSELAFEAVSETGSDGAGADVGALPFNEEPVATLEREDKDVMEESVVFLDRGGRRFCRREEFEGRSFREEEILFERVGRRGPPSMLFLRSKRSCFLRAFAWALRVFLCSLRAFRNAFFSSAVSRFSIASRSSFPPGAFSSRTADKTSSPSSMAAGNVSMGPMR